MAGHISFPCFPQEGTVVKVTVDDEPEAGIVMRGSICTIV